MSNAGTEPPGALAGSDRFEIVRHVGAGGMGAVYEAIDRERGERVALKTLRDFGPLELFLFKNEFRSLANIVHPNLVGLHELLAEGSTWFFTMDFVPGSELMDFVRGAASDEATSLHPDARSQALTASDGGRAPTHQSDDHLPHPDANPTPGEASTDIPTLEETFAVSDAEIQEVVSQSVPALDDTFAVDDDSLNAAVSAGSAQGIPTIDDTFAVDELVSTPPSASLPSAGSPPSTPAPRTLDDAGMERLRSTLGQLCLAVHALHGYGKLHRDIKPSNILVDEDGRVVLLDFGLIVELREEADESKPRMVAGTAAYMSPEQARGDTLTAASDWYAVGCILHEALLGTPPFVGSTLDVVMGKARGREMAPLPPAVIERTPDLAMLCEDLLRPDPDLRPEGAEVLGRLHVERDTGAGLTTSVTLHVATGDLVGRDEHLTVLRDAFGRSTRGGTEVVFVHGRSGMGKSELIGTFLDELRVEDVLILKARCYEREWVPFKAVDPIIDSLVDVLLERRDATLVPIHVGSLVRLFPVLERVPELADASKRDAIVTEPTELRRRAVAGFADLLRRIAKTTPIALFVDDLQWSDFDSVYVFEELLGEPEPPPLLLLGAYRDEEAETSPLLRSFSGLVVGRDEAPVRRLEVGPLDMGYARALARTQLGKGADKELAGTIAEESRGVPFFIAELARYVHSVPGGEFRGVLNLDEVVRSRVQALPPVARELLEVAATAARPTSLPLLARVCDAAEAWKVAVVLQHEQLLQSLGSAGSKDDRVECYHDRIREAVFASLGGEEARVLHLGLAEQFEAEAEPDAERVAVHLVEAGQRSRALPWVKKAAAAADRGLAFERAAALYGQAAELEPDEGEKRRMQTAQGAALVNAGRGVEAASAYLAAAKGADTEDAWRLTQTAADQLLRAGRLEEGDELVQKVLVEAGMSIPGSELGIILRYLGNKIRLGVRGLGFKERPESALTSAELGRLDVAASASAVLAMTDTLAGALMHTRNLRISLDAGEPMRVVRALAVEASFTAVAGHKAEAKALEILDTATALADRIEDPRAQGYCCMVRSLVYFQSGRWKESAEHGRQASRMMLEHCRGMHYEVGLARAYELADLGWLGRLRSFALNTADWIDEATDRNDLNAWLLLRLGGPLQLETLQDEPELAAERVLDVRGRWPDERFGILDIYVQRALADLALYRGDAAAALTHADALWTGLFKSQLKMVAILQATAFDVMGRALTATGSDPKKLATCQKKLAKHGPGWGEPSAAILAARGVDGWRAAVTTCEGADMAMHAAAARWRLGEAMGDAGAEEMQAARAWFEAEEVAAPERLVAMLAPAASQKLLPG